MPVIKLFYDDGGSATAPYDTWVKASTSLVTAVSALAAGDWIWAGNDSSESINPSAEMILTFPGTPANPNYLVSVTKNTPPDTPSKGCDILVGTNGDIQFRGSVYVYGLVLRIATTTGGGAVLLLNQTTSKAWQVFDTCDFVFVGTGTTNNIKFNPGTLTSTILVKNCSVKYSHASQTMYCGDKVTIDNLIIDPTGSAPTVLFTINTGVNVDVLIQNSNLTGGASAMTIFPSTGTYLGKYVILNCKLPSSWSGNLVSGGSFSNSSQRAEMYNCDSGSTKYRRWIIDYFGSLVQETTLTANSGMTDGATRLSWKLISTANSNIINPFKSHEQAIPVPVAGATKTWTFEIIHNAAALLTNADIWPEVDCSADTGSPLYQKASGRVSDIIVATPANWTASTKNWSDLVTARANTHVYALGDLIKVSTNAGRVFICTTAGTSAGSEPAGYATAIDGGTVADGVACVFTAMTRQTMSVTAPANLPAMTAVSIAKICLAKASATVYVDMMDADCNTLRMIPGSADICMDIPLITNVDPSDTSDGIPGTNPKKWADSDSTDPGVSHVDVDAVASYKINGATLTPTLSLAAEKTAYENSRNDQDSISNSDLRIGKVIKIKNTTFNGTLSTPGAPSKPVITARVWGSGKIRIDWTASSDATSYTVKRDGATIATLLIDTSFYLDAGLSAASYSYVVEAVGSGGTTASDAVVVSAELTDSEATLWSAFKDVMFYNAALSAFVDTYAYTRLEPGYTSEDSPLFKAWPYVVDNSTGKLSITVAIQARVYGTTVTMEDSLMTFSKLVRDAIGTFSELYPLFSAVIVPDAIPEMSEAVDANFNEAYFEVKVSVI